jgi:hypothetical protein
MSVLAGLVALVLAAIAGLHVYWAAGGLWPGRDRRELADKVIGPVDMPAMLPCLVVAAALLVAAVLVATRAPLAWGVAAVLGLRGVYGFVEARLRPSVLTTPYHRLSTRFYSPLCLALAGATALTL